MKSDKELLLIRNAYTNGVITERRRCLEMIDKFREKCCLCINFEEKGDLHLFNNYFVELKQEIQSEVGEK